MLEGLKELSEKGKYSKKNFKVLEKAAEFYRTNINEPEKAVLIHGDLNIMNIMADKKTMKLNGFIDPCNTLWADREYDLFQLLNMWGTVFICMKHINKKILCRNIATLRLRSSGR